MPAILLALSGGVQGELVLGRAAAIGRHPQSTLQVHDDKVSGEHCVITQQLDGSYLLEDAASLNGTWINGRRLRGAHPLRDGDEIGLGDTRLRFELRAERPSAVGAVTLFSSPSGDQTVVHSRAAASPEFLPAREIRDEAVLRADYEKLRAAHLLSQRLSLSTDLDGLLERIVDESLRLIPSADRAVILLYDAERDALEPRHARYAAGELGGEGGAASLGGGEIRLSRSVLDEVRASKQAVLCSDMSLDERFKSAESIIVQGIRSTMCVPLLHDGALLGVMHLDSKLTTGAFTEKDLSLFTGIATQAAVALQNQRLAQKIEWEAATRTQVQRLLSPNLVEEVIRGKLRLDEAGSLREVTMLFADIRGFTGMAERLTPTELVDTLNAYFEVMVEVLFRHGGTLDKYVGDELIGLFGAPVDLEDAPLQAVRCALDMHFALTRFNRERAAAGHEPIEMGVGINSGEVIAGTLGSRRSLQYTVIGDAVNVASRLCDLAGPGEVILSESTLRGCRDQVEFEARTPVQVKGRSAPLAIFRALAVEGTDVGPRRVG